MTNLLAPTLCQHARAAPAARALIVGEVVLSYGELADRVLRIAGWLRARGLAPGGLVAIDAVNGVEMVEVLLAAVAAGGVAFPVDRTATATELEAALAGEPVAAVSVADDEPPPWAAVVDAPMRLGPGDLDGARRAPRAADLVERAPLDPAMILLTSGTTSAPKAAVLSHRELRGNGRRTAHTFGLSAKDVGAVIHPLSNILNLSSLLAQLEVGAAVVLTRGLTSPPHLLDALARHGVTGFSCVPSAVELLARGGLPGRTPPALRYVRVGGPFSAAQLERTSTLLPGVALFRSYGMTESGLVSMLLPSDPPAARDSVGRPYPEAHTRILDESGGRCGPRVEGAITVDGCHPMLGYLRDPEATARVLRPDGIHTGDRGFIDEVGYLHFKGRSKELIKVSGESVWAHEIEAALRLHPAVDDVAVIGAPNNRLGEAPWAFVVVAPAATLASAEILRHARYHLPPRKVPVGVVFLTELPRTRTSKVRTGELQAALPPDHERC
ncbi:MAG TPA: class I adenylate-forming enzyme family protein [Polyangia bacterium]|jgi:acyl-CoA synthetase (AMP-forming)/AMP-acid ligase II